VAIAAQTCEFSCGSPPSRADDFVVTSNQVMLSVLLHIVDVTRPAAAGGRLFAH
jgi:hypothetical protein